MPKPWFIFFIFHFSFLQALNNEAYLARMSGVSFGRDDNDNDYNRRNSTATKGGGRDWEEFESGLGLSSRDDIDDVDQSSQLREECLEEEIERAVWEQQWQQQQKQQQQQHTIKQSATPILRPQRPSRFVGCRFGFSFRFWLFVFHFWRLDRNWLPVLNLRSLIVLSQFVFHSLAWVKV